MKLDILQMSKPFSLPRAPQEQYSKYYLTTIKKGALNRYKIVWVGCPLECRFKSNDVKDFLSPKNIFIVKKEDVFEYCVIDNRGNCYRLPKKYYSLGFPNISLCNVPENNEMEVQITKKQKQVLPYIPKSFLESKRLKTTRKRRRVSYVESPPEKTIESINFNVSQPVPSWHILQYSEKKNDILKRLIVQKMRSVIKKIDDSSMSLNDPFEELEKIDCLFSSVENVTKFKTIIGFIYHYCRAELGLSFLNDPVKISEASVEALNF